MKFSRIRTALLTAALCGAPLLKADILIMKDGSKVEGTILSETPDAVFMRYRVTPKIFDEKNYPKADIQQVIKQTPQEVELIELKKLLPTPDLLKADQYEQIIQNRVRPFVNKYPGTPEAKEAEAMIAELQKEKARVSEGEVKLEGKWLTAKEAKAEKLNIEAFAHLRTMREAAAAQDWNGVMRAFDKFSSPKPGYIASSYYPVAVTEALAALEAWGKVIAKMARDQPFLAKQREDNLAKMVEPDLSRTKAGIEKEVNAVKTSLEENRRAGIRWYDPYKYDLTYITELQKLIVAESKRLSAINLDNLKAQNEVFMAVYRKIGEEDYKGGLAAYQRAEALNPQGEYKEVVASLKAQMLQLYQKLSSAAAANANAVSGSSAMGGAATTATDDKVARLLAAQNGGAAPAPAAGAPAAATPAAAAPAAGAPAATPAAAAAPAAAPGTPAAAPAVAAPRPATAPVAPAPAAAAPAAVVPAPAAPVAAVAAPAEESGMQTYIMIGAGALVVLLGLVFLMQKKKPAAEE